jgi:hypothetical protein
MVGARIAHAAEQQATDDKRWEYRLHRVTPLWNKMLLVLACRDGRNLA